MIQPEEVSREDWPATRVARFKDHRTHSFHFAEPVLAMDPRIEGEIRASVKDRLTVECKLRTRRGDKYRGINRRPWEKAVRASLADFDWSQEAGVDEGLVVEQRIGADLERFDLARYDTAEQVTRLWNLCFGERALADGPSRWETFLNKLPAWAREAERLGLEPERGPDKEIKRNTPLVLGEIQGGNWGLLYRDLFKLFAAAAQTEVDLFVYIVPDGSFSEMISDNTVSFERVIDFLGTPAYRNVLRTPIWVVGVDIDGFSGP